MTDGEITFIIVALTILLVIGNILFSKLAERRNPPIGKFIDCDGVRLHSIDSTRRRHRRNFV